MAWLATHDSKRGYGLRAFRKESAAATRAGRKLEAIAEQVEERPTQGKRKQSSAKNFGIEYRWQRWNRDFNLSAHGKWHVKRWYATEKQRDAALRGLLSKGPNLLKTQYRAVTIAKRGEPAQGDGHAKSSVQAAPDGAAHAEKA